MDHLNQPNNLRGLISAGRELAFASQSPGHLPVVFGPSGWFHCGSDFADGLAVFNSGESAYNNISFTFAACIFNATELTVSLTWLSAIPTVARLHASLELVLLNIEIELSYVNSYVLTIQTRRRPTFLKLPFSPLTQNLNCSSSGLTTPAFAVTSNPLL